jgi:type II secretory pathway component PulC
MKRFVFTFVTTLSFLFIVTDAFSQSKAQIHIKRNQDGVQSEETRDVLLEEGQDIQEILIQMGVLDELGQLKSGQELEIRIDKTEGAESLENLELFFAPLPPDMPELPDFAMAPPMENRPFLGVMLKQNSNTNNGDETSEGVFVSEVIAGTAAEKAGLLAGDRLLKIDDLEITNVDQVIDYIQSHNVGDRVEIQIMRDEKKKKFKAELGEKAMEKPIFPNSRDDQGIRRNDMPGYNFRFGPDSITIFCPSKPNCMLPNDSMKICQPFSWNQDGMAVKETAFLGVTPQGDQPEIGVKVNIESETSAEKMGLQDGDVIISINQKSVNQFDQLAEVISQLKPGEIVKIEVLRDGKRKDFSGEIGVRSVSGFDDFRIFHDFKGMDEGGNYFYDFEFDMDEQDIEQRMQQLLEEIEIQQSELDAEKNRIESELDRMQKEKDVVIIKIQIADITQEELEVVNQNASPKLEIDNDLSIEQISFFPNPSDGILNLNFVTTSQKPVKVVLYSGKGEVVYLEERSSFDGKYNKTIDISNEPNGTYYLQITQDGKSYSKKIVKGM